MDATVLPDGLRKMELAALLAVVEVSSGAMVRKGINIPAALQSRTTMTGFPIHCFKSETIKGIYSVLFLSKTQISP